MMRRRWMIGAAALALLAAPVAAQEMSLDQAVAAGYLTQADVDRAEGRMAAAGDQMVRVLERDLPQLRNTLDQRRDGLAVDVAPFLTDEALREAGITDRNAFLNDPDFARKTAEGIVGGYKTMMEVERTAGNTIRPLIQTIFNESVAAQQELADALRRNGAPPALIAQQEAAVADLRQRGVPAIQRRLDEHDANIREAERILRERETEIIQKTTQAIKDAQAKYGPDPRRWPQNAVPSSLPPVPTTYLDIVAPPPIVGGPGYLPGQINGPSGVNYGASPAPSPRPAPAPAAGGTQVRTVPGTGTPVPSPGGTPTPDPTGTPRPVQKGTVPGKGGDPYGDFRVPANQGGTGPAQPGSQPPRPVPQAQAKPSPAPAKPAPPPPPKLTVPPTKLPEDRPPPGQSAGGDDLGLSIERVETAGGGGRSPSPGDPVSRGGDKPSMTVQKTPPPRQTDQIVNLASGPVNISKLMRDAQAQKDGKSSTDPKPAPPKPLTPAQLAEIKRVMDTLPKNKDGSIDLEAGLKAMVGGASDWMDKLLEPAPAAKPAATDAAKQAVKTTAAAQKPKEPFVQPRQPGGPDYPLAKPRTGPPRLSNDPLWMGGDAFMNAAMAAYLADAAAAGPDVVDVSRAAIDQRLADALAAWDRLADEVYYDEDGVIHRIPKDRPVNDYVKPPAPTRPIDDSAWGRFERGQGSLSVLELEAIYAGYDIDTMAIGSSGRSLSAAGQSLSAAPQSLKVDWHLPGSGDSVAQIAFDRAMGNLARTAADMGLPVNWGGLDLASSPIRVTSSGLPPAGSYAAMLRVTNQGGCFNPNDPFGTTLTSTRPVLCGR